MSNFRSWMPAVASAAAWLAISGCAPNSNPSTTSKAATAADSTTTFPLAAKSHPDPTSELFERTDVTTLTLEIAPAERVKLAENAREYVRCRLCEHDGETWADVAVKLKGAAGSFRELDDKPAFTLNMDKFRKKQSFHGLTKFHLNNSVQDETYLHEWLCAGLFREAGIAVPRVTHARVRLDDHDLGLYVLKEGFDKKFLARHFTADDGNLYDGGFCQDIDAELERDAGRGVADGSDVRSLLEACRIAEPEPRWQQIAEKLDIEAFLTFAAMELMTCHWDGYCLQKNNYRLYFEPASGRAQFLPHGMDQMFGDPGASILDRPGAIVAAAVMENPQWRQQYRDRIRQLLPLFRPADKLFSEVDRMKQRIQPVLDEVDPAQGAGYVERVQELKDRLIARAENLFEQSEQPDPPPPRPLEFPVGEGIELADWQPASEREDAILEIVELSGDRAAYVIRCGPGRECIASWRRAVLLARGEYRLAVSAATIEVAPLKDEKGAGAGVRISGGSRSTGLEGTTDWLPLEFRFLVTDEEHEIILVAELRATAGQVQFDVRSMRLYRLP